MEKANKRAQRQAEPKQRDGKKLTIGQWFVTAVQKLIEHNHQLSAIRDYSFDQFIVFLDAAERADAASRLAFTMDVSVAVSGLFSKDGITKHIDSLQETIDGE